MAILTVTNNADAGKGSLREAITTAQSGDTIKFAASLTNQKIALNQVIYITKSLTIDAADAPGLTISGGKKTNLFGFGQPNNNLTVRNLTLADAYNEGSEGGAIWAEENSTIKVENTKFLNNVSDGAALHAKRGSDITVINSTFDGNDGATISDKEWSAGAISLFENGSLTVKGSTFTNNKGYSGGAFRVIMSDVFVEDSLFKGNDTTAGANKTFVMVPGAGGAIYLDGASVPQNPKYYTGPLPRETGGVLSIRNSRFENNRAAALGGAILAYGYGQDRITIANSTIVNNEVIKNHTGTAEGGGVWLWGHGDIQNTKIANNKSADLGGGLYTMGEEVPTKITNSKFSGNQAVNGGAIYAGSSLEIDRTPFESNSAVKSGGVLYRRISNSPVSLQDSPLTNNTASDIADDRYGDPTSIKFDRYFPDIRYGSHGNDTISGTDQNNYLVGSNGVDNLSGNGGDDYLDGGIHDDSLSGGAGNDTLTGGVSFNKLYGEDGDDTFIGGKGQDLMEGGSGRDRYIIGDENQLFYSDHPWYDHAVIRDFEPKQDLIQLKGQPSDYTIKPADSLGVSGTGIFYNDGLVALVGDISPNNFNLNANYIDYM